MLDYDGPEDFGFGGAAEMYEADPFFESGADYDRWEEEQVFQDRENDLDFDEDFDTDNDRAGFAGEEF